MKPAQRTPRTTSDDVPPSQGRAGAGGGREEIRAALLKPYLLRVRAEKGVELETALVRKAGLPESASRNETAWISAQAAHKALVAVEKLLGPGSVARRGSFGAHPEALGAYVRLVHRTSGPKEAFRVFCDQSSEATRVATYTFEDVGPASVKITYTPIESDDPPVHSALLSQAREAELVAIPTLFGEPEATVSHPETTAEGGPHSVYLLTFSPTRRALGLPVGALAGATLAALPALGLGPSLATLASAIVGLGLGGLAGYLYDHGKTTSRGQALERHRINALERGLELRGDLATSSLPPGVLDGTVLGGKYKILHKIGSGGIGVIYSAEHLTLGSIVAVKVLRGAAARDAAEIARLRREAQVQVSIQHPNVVQTLDLDQMPDGSLYVVMELLRGRTLAEKMRSGPVPPTVAVPVFREVCFGLAACHAHGVVHRDMKPGNIFLCQDGTVKVLDFGMSKTDSSETLTQEGFTLGTPEYMAPEQCTGGEVEPRTDLYAFGVLMYEALTGELPIRASTRRELLDLHQRKVPATMAQCRPDLDIPPELDAAVMKCLEKKPRDRPADARALEEMLALVPGTELPDHRRSSLPPLPPVDF
jgi:eukaryotic-like serine/threonine-protein kinase